MGILLGFAFISGLITILSPCILPVLPIVLSSAGVGGKARPFGVITGFVIGFTFFTLALSALVTALGIPADTMRTVAIALIMAFGLVLLVPRLRDGFERLATRLASKAAQPRKASSAGFWGGLPLGLSLGLIWTPCVGPIMASVISLALTQRVDGGSVLITLAYSLGTAVPMLAVMLGGRALLRKVPALARNASRIQRVFGIVMIAMGIVLALQWDRKLQTALLAAFPSYGAGLTAVENTPAVRAAIAGRGRPGGEGESPGLFAGASSDSPPNLVPGAPLPDFGSAPGFGAQGPWLSGRDGKGQDPLTLGALAGRVVLVDFWTYSCVNCIRTLPWLKAWDKAYGPAGLVTLGVHTPEFAFEQVTANVEAAMRDLGVVWPVVQDNDYAQWKAYGNKFWPAHYLIDARGQVRYWHFGEGGYAETEAAIRSLLAEAGARLTIPAEAKADPSFEAKTPEIYLGYERARGFASAVKPEADKVLDYKPARKPALAEWNLGGRWTIAGQYIEPESAGTLELGFDARDVYIVIESEEGTARIKVLVDGLPVEDTEDVRASAFSPTTSRLYHLVALPLGGAHVLSLEVTGKVRLFSFTFG